MCIINVLLAQSFQSICCTASIHVEDYLNCNVETLWLPVCPGFELTFYSGVYGTCLGAMTQFGDDAKGLIGLSGILIGVGEIIGKSVHNNCCASVLCEHSKCNKPFLYLTRRGSIWYPG